MKFYVCEHCGNIVEAVKESGVPIVCCGQKMTKLEAGAVEASREKHIPVVTRDGDKITVNVGSVKLATADLGAMSPTRQEALQTSSEIRIQRT